MLSRPGHARAEARRCWACLTCSYHDRYRLPAWETRTLPVAHGLEREPMGRAEVGWKASMDARMLRQDIEVGGHGQHDIH